MSIVQKNAALLVQRFYTNTKYIDLNYVGTDKGEDLISLSRTDALINEVKLWLLSSKGDYYERPLFGGIFDAYLNVSMSDNIASEIEGVIQNNFSSTFVNLTLNYVKVTPDYKKKTWNVDMAFTDNINQNVMLLTAGIAI